MYNEYENQLITKSPTYSYYSYSDSYPDMAIMDIDSISIISDFEIEDADLLINEINIENINVEPLYNTDIIQNKIFNSMHYKKELTRRNTFLDKKKYQIEFNKLIIDKTKIKLIDKIILKII